MTRSRFFALAFALLFVLAFAIGTTPVETAQAPAPATGPRTARDAALAARQSKQLTATFVGADTCLACHDDKAKPLERTPHGKSADPRTPAAAEGCETCHGPGSAHIEDPSDPATIKRFDKTMAPRNANETCLSCHTKAPITLWKGSAHDARNLPCGTCHSVHAAVAPEFLLRKTSELELCASCHRLQVTKVQRVSHMPLIEGKMTCSSCHNPHGSTNVRLLRVGNWINESCLYCHTEKRGPFLFEHAAGRESCVSCHDPHGTNTHAMLVARPPMLCQRCHIGTRHPSTIYDNTAVQARSNRIIGRSCVNCHQNIHGSNHPSGQTLVR
ncbi:MAG TPA: DmsE family decaheme c-type cytochrome [Vicinamibacterales bacterium]|nr:DmsE family decaheme c-type cytochrome [Vicinamibacterales bacterium]